MVKTPAKPLYVTPHPPNKPKPYLYRPKPFLPIISKAVPAPQPKAPTPPPQNIIIRTEQIPILSNADNKEIMDIDLSLDKLMQNIKELRAQLDIKLMTRSSQNFIIITTAQLLVIIILPLILHLTPISQSIRSLDFGDMYANGVALS